VVLEAAEKAPDPPSVVVKRDAIGPLLFSQQPGVMPVSSQLSGAASPPATVPARKPIGLLSTVVGAFQSTLNAELLVVPAVSRLYRASAGVAMLSSATTNAVLTRDQPVGAVTVTSGAGGAPTVTAARKGPAKPTEPSSPVQVQVPVTDTPPVGVPATVLLFAQPRVLPAVTEVGLTPPKAM
jgi:hypothetical protein